MSVAVLLNYCTWLSHNCVSVWKKLIVHLDQGDSVEQRIESLDNTIIF